MHLIKIHLQIVQQKIEEYKAKSTRNPIDDTDTKKVNNFIDECIHLLLNTKTLTKDDLIIESIHMLIAVFTL